MRNLADERELLAEDERPCCGSSQARMLGTHEGTTTPQAEACRKENASRWSEAQDTFLEWTKDRRIFTEEYIERGKRTYDAFFKKRGPLRGNVLDIGGGWGLFRQWWEPGESDVFIVHDPGVERYLRGPYEFHRYCYQRAFSLPMTFVEGLGESLSYKNDVFDMCLIAATLDHCAEPQEVMAEAYRCLKPSGIMLVIQDCHASDINGHRPHFLRRLFKHLHHPRHLLALARNRLYRPDHHLHHFSPTDVTSLLEQVGFSRIRTSTIPPTQDVFAFEGEKEKL